MNRLRVGGLGGYKPPARAWVVTLMALAFMLINFADKAVMGLTAVPMMKELDLSPAEFGFANSAFYFLFNVSAIAVGFIATRMSARISLFALAAVWTIAQIPLAFTVPFTAVVLTRILLGIGEGPAYPMANHAAFQWFPPKSRSFPSSLLTTGVGLGGVVAAPILGFVIVGYGWHAAFLTMGIASGIWAILWLLLAKDGPLAATRRRTQEHPQDDTHAQEQSQAEASVPYRRVFTTRTFVGGVLGGFASYWGLATMIAWLPAFLEKVGGVDAGTAGFLLILPWGAQALITLFTGWLVHRLRGKQRAGRHALEFVGGFTLIVGGVFVLVFGQLGYGVLQLVLMTLGFGTVSAIYALQQTSVSEIAPMHQRSAVLSTSNALLTLGGICAPFIAGLILDAAVTPAAGYRSVFLLGGAIMIIGGAIFAVMVRPARDGTRLGVRTHPHPVAADGADQLQPALAHPGPDSHQPNSGGSDPVSQDSKRQER